MLNDCTVEVRGFTKRYGSKTACDHVDFSAQCGMVTGLLGPNGSGKSTLLKAVCGVHYPSEGSVSVGPYSSLSDIRRVVGFVPETPQLDRFLTVRETLESQARLYGADDAKVESIVGAAVKDCALGDVLNVRVSALSKGYAQRTSFAKALCADPKVLVLDEFSGGLDPAQMKHMRNLVKSLSKDRAVILSTHYIEEALSLCSVIYVMSNARVVAFGSPSRICELGGGDTLEQSYINLTGGDAQ